MAQQRILDYMQAYPFWLMDVSFPSPVLLPAFGFSAITAPEMTGETHEIKEGNWYFPRNVVIKGAVNSITLTRGVQFFDNDFWRWITATIAGDKAVLGKSPMTQALAQASGASVRRNLLLIHFTSFNPVGHNPLGLQLTRVPGKAWMLYDCLPTKYKAASDFDATSSAISLQELEVKPEWFEEFSVGPQSVRMK